MATSRKKVAEEHLYEPIGNYLTNLLGKTYSNYCLEITARGVYSEVLKHFVHHDIVFAFLKIKQPDLTGFILKKGTDIRVASSSAVETFITVEIKKDKIQLLDIAQAKIYGDLFCAKYALLISTEIIGEEIRRLHDKLRILNRYRNWKVYVGQAILEQPDRSIIKVTDIIWVPSAPF